MRVLCVKNNPVDSNSFVIYQEDSSDCIIVDPGTQDCKDILRILEENRLSPQYIILTHEHFDHIWGTNLLKDIFGCKIICSRDCADRITDRKKNLSVFYDQVGFETYPADIIINDCKESLLWNGLEIQFFPAKGHTEGSICFLLNDNLFTGDTIIKNHKTVVKFPGGSKEKLQQSIDYIFSVFKGKKIVVYPGHGDSFCLDEIEIEEIY